MPRPERPTPQSPDTAADAGRDATPIGFALRDYALQELGRALICLSWRGSRLHAGVHQARKSLRRTRATLALGADVLGAGAAPLDRRLRRVNRSLSDLRDAQALVETLDRLVKKHRSPGTHRLLQRARRAAANQRARMARVTSQKDGDFAARRAALAQIANDLAVLPWPAIDENMVRAALGNSRARADAAGVVALASEHSDDWHRWRRRMRRLSQQIRALRGRPTLKLGSEAREKALAVLLGEAQDYGLLREHCDRRSPFSVFDRRALIALADKGTQRKRARVLSLAR
jgi:CHAD domain-containing protein